MFRTFSSVLILMAGSLAASGGHPKVDKDLDKVNPESTVDVIIQYKQLPTATHHQKVQGRGGTHKRDLGVIKGGHYAVPAKALAELANDPDVIAISPDRVVSAASDQSMASIGADIARSNGYDGTGIGIAVIDSGVTKVGDTKTNGVQRVVYDENFVVGTTSLTDVYGHGTHVAYTAAGNGVNSSCSTCTQTFRGVAPNANIINLRVLDNNGAGKDSAVIAAIQRAVALKSTYNIRVMNLSLGRPVASSYLNDPLCQAVEAAWKAGIVVVVAAGNEGRNNSQGTNGYATITAPGNDPYVITVGAMKTLENASRADDLIASYSSKGPTLLDHIVKPDLVAPGNRIIAGFDLNSNLAKTYPQNIVPLSYYGGSTVVSKYFSLSGTSMATPMVSGAAALLIQKDPTLTPDQVKARLMRTATKAFPSYSTATDPVTGTTYTAQYDVFTVGAGYLDVWAALNDTTAVMGTALSPSVTYDSVNKKVSLAFANGVVWGTAVVWGTGIVWGNGVVWGTGIVWGNGVVWGTGGVPSGTGIVWGDAVVWGTSTPAGEATGIAINGES